MHQQTLDKIQEYAELQFSAEDIETILDLSEDEIRGNQDATNAYLRGYLEAQAKVRRVLYERAKEGARSQDVNAFLKLGEELEANDA